LLKRKALTTRDDFDALVFPMDDALEEFLAALPEAVRGALDYSPASVAAVEGTNFTRDCFFR